VRSLFKGAYHHIAGTKRLCLELDLLWHNFTHGSRINRTHPSKFHVSFLDWNCDIRYITYTPCACLHGADLSTRVFRNRCVVMSHFLIISMTLFASQKSVVCLPWVENMASVSSLSRSSARTLSAVDESMRPSPQLSSCQTQIYSASKSAGYRGNCRVSFECLKSSTKWQPSHLHST
jgi:hypothetical protein